MNRELTLQSIAYRKSLILSLLHDGDLEDDRIWHNIAKIAKEIEELLISLG